MSTSFIHQLINISAQYADKKAFDINGKAYSYSNFYQKVNNIGNELLEQNLHQKKIIVNTSNSIETYASIIAIWLTGNTYIPLNFEANTERIKSILAIVEADIILSDKVIKNECISGINLIETSTLSHPGKPIVKPNISENAIAYILFTSGTTGVPKGVPISYQNLAAFVDSFLSLGYSFTADDNFLQMADLTFDMSIISTLIPLCVGASITTINNEEIKYLATYKALLEQNISVLVTAPSTLKLLEPYYSEINLDQLNYTFVGAEAFYQTTATQWQTCAPNSQIINLYGPSEGGILSSSFNWNLDNNIEHQGIVSIGSTVKNINLYIVDEQENIITDNQEGEAWISGKQVFDSYLDDTMNQNKFGYLTINGVAEKCFKTGDLMFRDNDGNLFYCGRKDEQIQVQGNRVELKEIEFYTNKMGGKFQSAAISFKGEFDSDQIALFIDKDIDLDKLSAQLKLHLPVYMLPKKIIGLDELPLNKNQKVDKKILSSYLK